MRQLSQEQVNKQSDLQKLQVQLTELTQQNVMTGRTIQQQKTVSWGFTAFSVAREEQTAQYRTYLKMTRNALSGSYRAKSLKRQQRRLDIPDTLQRLQQARLALEKVTEEGTQKPASRLKFIAQTD